MNLPSSSRIRIKTPKPDYVFNLLNGKIRKLGHTRLKGLWEIYIWNEPKKNCKHCYGRGYIGKDNKTKVKVSCKCIFKNKPKFEDLI